MIKPSHSYQISSQLPSVHLPTARDITNTTHCCHHSIDNILDTSRYLDTLRYPDTPRILVPLAIIRLRRSTLAYLNPTKFRLDKSKYNVRLFIPLIIRLRKPTLIPLTLGYYLTGNVNTDTLENLDPRTTLCLIRASRQRYDLFIEHFDPLALA